MLQKLGKEILIFDGALGTELQKKGLKLGQNPEELNITNPQLIQSIHQSYAKNANFISTNTFGANRLKLKSCKYSVKEVVEAAINNVKAVAKNNYVALSIGPIGQLLEPLGKITFDEAYDIYKEIIEAAIGVDVVLLETMTDIYELKAAILAIKENSNFPIFATMSFEENARTLTGTTPEAMVTILEGLGIQALGVNCSLGPKELKPIVRRIANLTTLPIIVQANAGLPTLRNSETIYTITSEEFNTEVKELIEMGTAIVGGCCGTTPEFIEKLSINYRNNKVIQRTPTLVTAVSSGTTYVPFNQGVIPCGERLNPTGKKKLKQAIVDKDYDYLVREAINQEEAGALVLDVNVGVPMIDEQSVMKEVITKLQEVVSTPLQIDSSNYLAIETAARYYNGKPLINSVNGEIATMERVFPIVKKYGGVVIGLTLDENGVPRTAKERLEIAKRILNTALKYGIKKNDIIIDCLVLTASAEQELVSQTLEALKLVKQEGLNTALGVSNVSFGLPNRPLINKTFLAMAIACGLDMPILNPLDKDMMDVILVSNVLKNIDKDSKQYIEQQVETTIQETKTKLTLTEAIKKGLKTEIKQLVFEELNAKKPMDVINEILIPALNEVGIQFEKGKIFLPQLIQSAEATKEAFSVISKAFQTKEEGKGPIILATVKGDVHDIGKNIVKVVLESYGFNVIDLGKDVPKETVVEAFKKHSPKMIGLSALMTTTVKSMEEIIKELKEIPNMCPIFVGGAVLTQEVADEIGADYYAKDALASAQLCSKIIEG